MKSREKIILIAGTMMLGLAACDMKKQLTEMHDSTGRLEQNTKKMGETTENMDKTTASMYDTTTVMAKTTSSMHGTTQGMSAVTNELVDLARMNDSSSQRRDALHAIKTADSLGMKVEEGAKYFSSFEFQLFNGLGQDSTKEKRTELQYLAVAEFFKALKEFDTGADYTKALAQAKSGDEANKDASFNAIAATLHVINRKQNEYLKSNTLKDTEKVSMLSMITSSLEKKEAINKGEIRPEEISEYTKEVLANERLALRLIQARVTAFSTIAFGEVSLIQGWPLVQKAAATNLDSNSITGRIAKGAGQLLSKVSPSLNTTPQWELKVEKFNVVQLQLFVKLMNQVLEGQQFLTKLGVVPHKDESLKTVLNNVVYVEAKDQVTGPLLEARQKFKETLNQFLPTQK